MKHTFYALLLLASLGGTASGEIVHFIHPHPIAPGYHKGMCYIEGPHVHNYKPHKPVLYVQVDGNWAFIGDPTEFGHQGPRYAYYSHHPIFWIDNDDPTSHYCYINGPHYHLVAPPPELSFTFKGGVYWWVSPHPKWHRKRWRKHRALTNYYLKASIIRPVVHVTPPAGFVAVTVIAPAPPRVRTRVTGGVVVTPPTAGVTIRPPSLNIQVRTPGVGVFVGPGHVRHRRIIHRRYRRVKRVKYRHHRRR